MASERFITLVIHTYDRAITLRKILESHGIKVKFENLVVSGTHIASGVRVKIPESDLPLALKIVESGDNYAAAKLEMKMSGYSDSILVPVDFSPYSMLAVKVAFDIASKLERHPIILHSYATPYFMGALDYADPLDMDMEAASGSEMTELMAGRDIRKEAEKMMSDFRKEIESAQADGSLPDIKFSVTLNEGVPEDVILEFCRLTPPSLVVMATRGKEKKEEDLVGSVTAEVLDSCRVPVIAVPDNYKFVSLKSIKKVVYFCNLDQHDIIAFDSIMRLLNYAVTDFTLVPVNDRAGSKILKKVNALKEYFTKTYPTATFSSEVFSDKNFSSDLEKYVKEKNIEFLVVPNKKKNIFSRLFNPGIAHRILFERDMPLLALPV